MSDDPPVEVDAACLEVVDGLLAGDRAAVAAVYQRFTAALVLHADRLIPDRQRANFSADSVVQSVMASLLDLDTADRDRLRNYRIAHWGQLYGLLARITVRKCLNRIRHFDTAGRSADRVAPVDAADLLARGPSVEDQVAYAEILTALWDHFTPAEQQIVRLTLDGLSVQEIADRADTTTTVVKNVRRKLSRWLDRRCRQHDAV